MRANESASDETVSVDTMLNRLLHEVDCGYLAFRSMRGSLADSDQLADEAAWVCWRTRRLLIWRTGRRTRARSLFLRGGAAIQAWVLRAMSLPHEELALAAGVRQVTERLTRDLIAAKALFQRDWESDTLERRLDELRRLTARASLVHDCMQRQNTPLWHQFVPRSS